MSKATTKRRRNIAQEMAAAERAVYGNVCRCCNRPIQGRLKEADRDGEGWPRCNECAACRKEA